MRQPGLPDGTVLFNLTLRDNSPGNGKTERFTQVAVSPTAGARRLDLVLQSGSNLARVQTRCEGEPDLPAMAPAMGQTTALGSGTDAGPLLAADYTGVTGKGFGVVRRSGRNFEKNRPTHESFHQGNHGAAPASPE